MFASRVTKQIEIKDGADKGFVTIRKLSAKSLEKAREARQMAAAALTSKFGADLIRAFRETNKEEREAQVVEVAVVDPNARYAEFDRDTVLTQGVVSWTFKDSLREGLADLDEPTAELLFHAIVDLSAPSTEEAAKVEKNG